MTNEIEAVRGRELMCDQCGCTRWKCLAKFDGDCCPGCDHPTGMTLEDELLTDYDPVPGLMAHGVVADPDEDDPADSTPRGQAVNAPDPVEGPCPCVLDNGACTRHTANNPTCLHPPDGIAGWSLTQQRDDARELINMAARMLIGPLANRASGAGRGFTREEANHAAESLIRDLRAILVAPGCIPLQDT